jgi:hypothetical protein
MRQMPHLDNPSKRHEVLLDANLHDPDIRLGLHLALRARRHLHRPG